MGGQAVHHSNRHQQFEAELRHVPEPLRDGFRAYFLNGARPTGLVAAIVNGSLFDAYARADADMRPLIPAIMQFVINTMPLGAYGNPHNVGVWTARGGLVGRPVRNAA